MGIPRRHGRRSLDLAAVALVTLTAIVASSAGAGPKALQMVAGILLVLALPGYALLAASPLDGALAPVERLLASLGASLAVAALDGLLLNATPWGMQTASWSLSLGALTLLACVVAAWRRRRVVRTARHPFAVRMAARDGILCAAAVLVATGAIGMARSGALRQPTHGFTQMWLLPQGRGNFNAVRIGIRNLEAGTTTYQLQVKAGKTVLFTRRRLTLRPGRTWQGTVTLPRGTAARIDGLLYRTNAPHVLYRHVTLWRQHQGS